MHEKQISHHNEYFACEREEKLKESWAHTFYSKNNSFMQIYNNIIWLSHWAYGMIIILSVFSLVWTKHLSENICH